MENIVATMAKPLAPIPVYIDEDGVCIYEIEEETIDDYETEITYYGEPVPDWARE